MVTFDPGNRITSASTGSGAPGRTSSTETPGSCRSGSRSSKLAIVGSTGTATRRAPPRLLSLRTLRRVSLRGDVAFDLVAEVVQKARVREGWFLGGSTIVISSEGEVRYAIFKHAGSKNRLAAQRRWLRTQPRHIQDAAWHENSMVSARLQRNIHRER